MKPWTSSSTEGRWCGLGPYYAMFPVSFARQVIGRYCPPEGRVLDPFCGRGTAPFVAAVTGREGVGVDINPVAWVYSSAKINPVKSPDKLISRIQEINRTAHWRDSLPQNEFQQWAWHPEVLSFLRSARRSLNWRNNRTDRTLMALILVHLHAKRGEGLSNQLRQTKSMSPEYAVKWWKRRKMKPPKIDVEQFFEKKIAWRYEKGVPSASSESQIRLGSSLRVLPQIQPLKADLLLTSPPYYNVTNYEYDNWIRLWLLGGTPLPIYRNDYRFSNQANYKSLLQQTFASAKVHCKKTAVIYVRTDAREFTRLTTQNVLQECWPNYAIWYRADEITGKTQTSLFTDKWSKAGEVDFLLAPRKMSKPRGFCSL